MVLGIYNTQTGKLTDFCEENKEKRDIKSAKTGDIVVIGAINEQSGANYNPRGRKEVRKPKTGDIYVFFGQDWVLIDQERKERYENKQ